MNKTCQRGHEMTPENTKPGNRCRACSLLRGRAYRERMRLLPKYESGPPDYTPKKRSDPEYARNWYLAHRRPGLLPPDTLATTIGYKEPLRPMKNGYGYEGTITYDITQTYTQCHICGWFFANLGSHAWKIHRIKADDYRERMGLTPGRSLLAPNTRAKWTNHWASFSKEKKQAVVDRLQTSRRMSNSRAGRIGGEASKFRLEKRNMRGSCPDQLLDKITVLAGILGRTPKAHEFRNHYGGFLFTTLTTFGTWSNAVKIAGLTPNRRGGYARRYTKDMLVDMLRNFKKEYGREPYNRDLRHGILPSRDAFVAHWPSWVAAKEAAYGKATSGLIGRIRGFGRQR